MLCSCLPLNTALPLPIHFAPLAIRNLPLLPTIKDRRSVVNFLRRDKSLKARVNWLCDEPVKGFSKSAANPKSSKLTRVSEAEGDHGLREAAWRELERDWASDAAHRRFIGLCAAQNALDAAGRNYRSVRDSDPTRREEAARRLNDVTAAAIEQLSLARAARPARGRRMMWLMVGICGFFVVRAVLTLLRLRSQ
jgi:hypothetical protein